MAPKNDPRTIFGWAMYDWANSAYATTVMAALLPIYFTGSVVPAAGYPILGHVVSGEALWGFLVGAVTFAVFLLTPTLGAIADFSAAKKRFLRAFAYGGSLFAIALFFVRPGHVALAMGLFLVTQVGFVSANVFYDGFLPDITTPETIDRVSARGYATGYVGGGLQFLLVLLLVTFADPLGIGKELAVRIGLASSGAWWMGFSIFAFGRLEETGAARPLPAELAALPRPLAYGRVGFGRVVATLRKLLGFRQLLLFLVAYLIYNDGIQTTITMAADYATQTLKLGQASIMVTLLIVQFVAFGGAYLFGRLAGRMGTRRAVLVCLFVYALVTVAAYRLPVGRVVPFFGLGAAVGLVQGGAQALSRSLYGSMIPEDASAEFYSFYSVLSKFAAIWGPVLFGVVREVTGSGRPAILSLIVFFIVGGSLLALVDIDEARASRERWSFEGEEARVTG
jgi:UMF1 family MFS transporter